MKNGPTIETWNTNPADLGPLYPYTGTEILLCVLCLIFFIAFMIWKFNSENQKYAHQAETLNIKRLTNHSPKQTQHD